MHTSLFKEVQEQFKLLGFSSLNEPFIKAKLTSPTAPPDPTTLPEILANMPPEKANKMLALLSKGTKGDLEGIKKLFEPQEQGYANYQRFLATHTIAYLGGNNSRNFKVTSLGSGKEFVLKVDNRLDAPKDAEALLRTHSLRDVLSPIYAERTATHGSDTRTLLVTDYCKGGNLEEHGKKFANDRERAQSALKIYTQMSTILKNISADNCAFPDMKNSNWLVNEKGVVQIADTKSFAFTDAGNLRFGTQANRWYEILSTPFMSSPEMGPAMNSSADKMHVFMLGKNLYQYLSGCRCSELENKNNGEKFDFSKPIFSTPEGKEFQIIIKSMVQLNTVRRIPMDAALESIQAIESKIATRELLKGLQDLNEPTFTDFIREKEVFIGTATREQLASLQATIRLKVTEASELKIARQETRVLLQNLQSLNESAHEPFIQEQDSFINKANQEQLASLQTNIKTKISEVNELKIARQETRVLLQNLQSLNESSNEPFIREQDSFINTANKEHITSLQANLRTKITETTELQTARQETRVLLQNLQSLNESSNEPFIREQDSFINTANKEQITSLQASLRTKITETTGLQTARQETRGLLKDLQSLHEPSHEPFIREQESFITSAKKEQLPPLNADINHKINKTKEFIALKEECSGLLQQFKAEARDKSSAAKVVSLLEKNITTAATPADLIPIKAEIETKLADEKALNTLQVEVPRLLEQIKAKGLGENDTAMNQYIKEKMVAISKVKDKREVDVLMVDLKKMLATLQDPKQAQEIRIIKDIALSIRDRDEYGSAKKATMIEQALCRVPLTQRGKIQAGETAETFEVLKALAYQRHMHKKDVYLTKEGKIDEQEAPKSFAQFKEAMKTGRVDRAPVKEVAAVESPDAELEQQGHNNYD